MVYLVETQNLWLLLYGGLLFLSISTITEGSACVAPSQPQCFRRSSVMTVYMCEWSLSKNESNRTFSLHTDESEPIIDIPQTWINVAEERLITGRNVSIWVESHVGNSTCTSPRITVTLGQIVKFEAPKTISVSWGEKNLNLRWPSAESFPALTEIWIWRDNPESKEKILRNATKEPSMYQVNIENLLKNLSYHVKIRHQSTQVKNPLWSKWSQDVSVPAELGEKPEVRVNTHVVNNTRRLTLRWKAMPPAASVGGVTYTINDSQSDKRCPCDGRLPPTNATNYTVKVSYSAVDVFVIARNTAGESPQTIIKVPAEPLTDLQICNKTMIEEKLNKGTCLEWYKHQEEDSVPINVTTLSEHMTKKEKAKNKKTLQDYVRYIYLEHRCHNGEPRTVEKCLFYQKEGAPIKTPLNFTALSETDTSVKLSWSEIPIGQQRGFLTHYTLCSVRSISQEEIKECFNVSNSVTGYNLENLIPGTKYNISLARVTAVGEGPKATVLINVKPGKRLQVWLLMVGLMVFFFILSATCTVVLKRVQNSIFPPVPTPIIPDFSPCQPESQEMSDRKEEVHQVTLLQIHQCRVSLAEDSEGVPLSGLWNNGNCEDMDDEKSDSDRFTDPSLSTGSVDDTMGISTEGEITSIEQVDHELSMLIYRNGLVLDLKTDSN